MWLPAKCYSFSEHPTKHPEKTFFPPQKFGLSLDKRGKEEKKRIEI